MYKLDLSTKWKIYNVFHMLLLELETTRKKRMIELFSEPEPGFDAGNNKKYKVEVIIDSIVYTKEIEGHLPSLYYLVFWKSYLEKKSTWEPSSIVMHLWKMISTLHKNHPKKPTATFPPLNSIVSMAKPSVKPTKPSVKEKQSHLIGIIKQFKE